MSASYDSDSDDEIPQYVQPAEKSVPTQSKDGPFVASKFYDSYLCKEEEGIPTFYDPKHQDFKGLTDFLEQNIDVIMEDLKLLTMVRMVKNNYLICF